MSKSSDRRATNVSLPGDLVALAKALDINLSRACQSGVEAAVAAERSRRWRVDNQAAFEAYNRWIEENGVPLDAFRQFGRTSSSIRRRAPGCMWWISSPLC